MREIQLSGPARRDLLLIARESEERWGSGQRVVYMREFDRRLAQLAERPQLGPLFDTDRSRFRRLSVGAHVIYYRFDATVIRVLRILHQRMNAADHLRGVDEAAALWRPVEAPAAWP